MWAALALTTVLTAPAQAGELSLKNVRSTYGVLGPARKDNKVLPGEVIVVAFDIEGLTVKEDGRVLYAMGMEVIKKGKTKPDYKRDPQDMEAINTLGGSTLPSFAMSVIGTETSVGEYTLKVTVKDRGTKMKKAPTVVLEEKFEVVPLKLGFVQVRLTSAAAEPVPPVGVPSQNVWLHFALVGFKTDEKSKTPHVTFEMQILDADGKPTLPKPFKGDIKVAPKVNPGMMTFEPISLQLNRSGKFKVVIKATCNLTRKTAEQTIDLNVLGK